MLPPLPHLQKSSRILKSLEMFVVALFFFNIDRVFIALNYFKSEQFKLHLYGFTSLSNHVCKKAEVLCPTLLVV